MQMTVNTENQNVFAVQDRNTSVCFEFFEQECNILVRDFITDNGINLLQTPMVASEHLQKSRQLSLFEDPVTKTSGQISEGTYSVTSDWSISNKDSTFGSSGLQVKVESLTQETSTLSPDNEFIEKTKELETSGVSYFAWSSDRNIADKCSRQQLNHLWSIDVLCWMYSTEYINGWKAGWTYRKLRKKNRRLTPEKLSTFSVYHNQSWDRISRMLINLGLLKM